VTDAVGVERFGEIMLIATLSQLLPFADLGVGAAVATESARLTGGSGDAERFRRTLLTALRTTIACFTTLTVVSVVIGLLGLWPTLLGLHEPDPAARASANLAAVFALVVFGASLPFALGEPVLRGVGHLHRAVLLVGLSPPLALVFTTAVRAVGSRPFVYALAIPAGAALGSVCCAGGAARTVHRYLAGVPKAVFRPRRHPGLPIAATAVPMFVVMLGLPLALQSDRLIIAHRLDATTLSTYSYVAQLYTPLWSVVSVAATALWPVFAGREPLETSVRRTWQQGIVLLGSAGVALAALFVLLSRPIVGFMSGGTAAAGVPLVVSFAVLLVVQALHVGTGMLLISPSQLRFQALCVVALVLTNIPLSWVLAPALGASGPVVASAITVTGCQLLPGLVVAHRLTSPAGRKEA
jgi:O-antigen/teichoic acid export membrane protein